MKRAKSPQAEPSERAYRFTCPIDGCAERGRLTGDAAANETEFKVHLDTHSAVAFQPLVIALTPWKGDYELVEVPTEPTKPSPTEVAREASQRIAALMDAATQKLASMQVDGVPEFAVSSDRVLVSVGGRQILEVACDWVSA